MVLLKQKKKKVVIEGECEIRRLSQSTTQDYHHNKMIYDGQTWKKINFIKIYNSEES